MNKKRRWHRVVLGLLLVPLALLLALAVLALVLLPYRGELETVRFQSGRIELVGDLALPRGEGPHPAIVLLHGSEAGTRGGGFFRLHANRFLSAGIAALSYDKRGCGDSGGDFEDSTIVEFAADAQAAVDYLRGRPDIEPSKIGFLGSSESAWFTPELAVRDGRIAFVIQRSGPPLPYGETYLFEVTKELEAAGASPEEIEEAIALRRRIWDYYRRAAADPALAAGPERARLEAAVEEARRSGWYEHFQLAVAEYDAALYRGWMTEIDYDPLPYLERMQAPMLAVFGGRDVNVPAHRSIELLERVRDEHGLDVTLRLYEDVGHSLGTWKKPHDGFLAGDYLDLIGAWAAVQVRAGEATPVDQP